MNALAKAAATIARVRTFAFSGIEAVPVEVQVQISAGLPAFLIVGPIAPADRGASCGRF